jgi:hypothetical protein
MTRSLYSLPVADVSAFARALKTPLDERHSQGKPPPSHLELLNLLARAAGLRNYQTLRATVPSTKLAIEPAQAQALTPASEPATLSPTARKALLQFDDLGRLVRLPTKLSVQRMCMWWLWTHFEVRRHYTEKEVNQVLNVHHTFGDQATLRRELVNMKLLGRKLDCSDYWKEPARADSEVQHFLARLRAQLR